MNEIVLTESRAARAEVADHTEVLDKVKALATLPGDVHVTTEMVASYYEVSRGAIDSAVRRNREELASNGLRTVAGDELRSLKRITDLQDEDLFGNARAVTLFTPRAVLNIGMLLVDSEVARRVRSAALDAVQATSDQGPRSPNTLLGDRARAISYHLRNGLIDRETAKGLARRDLEAVYGELPPAPPPRDPQAEASALMAEVLKLVTQNPGITTNRVCALVPHNKGTVARALHKAEADGALRVETGPNNSRRHLIVDIEREDSR